MSNRSKKEREQFLDKLHASFKTPDSKHEQLIKVATGKSIVNKVRIVHGEANEVYEITLSPDESVILRISHGDQFSFTSEKWAIEQAEKVGVPVPKVLYIEDFQIEDNKYSACVMQKLKGKPLDQVIKDENQLGDAKHFLVTTGKLLARLHTVKPTNFGHIRGEGIGENNSWYEFITRHKDKSEYFQQILKSRGVDRQYIPRIYDIFEQYKTQLEAVKPHLLHGDIGYDHIFVDGKKITGIIDFGIAKSGEPAHDLAWWDFFHINKEGLRLIEEGYNLEGYLGENYETRKSIEKLFLSLQLLNYYTDTNNEQGMQIVLKEMELVLGSFD